MVREKSFKDGCWGGGHSPICRLGSEKSAKGLILDIGAVDKPDRPYTSAKSKSRLERRIFVGWRWNLDENSHHLAAAPRIGAGARPSRCVIGNG